MKFEKKVIGNLEKCYSVSSLCVNGIDRLLVAAEKHAPCLLFDTNGSLLETVWTEPGGVMSLVPISSNAGLFMATHQFYSPNDSGNAKLVAARRETAGWKVTDVASMPFVHRFDVLSCNGTKYIIACTLKSNHLYKNDWSSPGKVYASVLPQGYAGEPLEFHIIHENMGHNHGYSRFTENGCESGIVSCDQGVFRFIPPEQTTGQWGIEKLIDMPCSDAVLVDLDNDGTPEIVSISPFHGDTLTIWKWSGENYEKAYTHPEKMPFLHAICAGSLLNTKVVLIGNRESKRELLAFQYDSKSKTYLFDVVDEGAGPANCIIFQADGGDRILAANRESNEIAIYTPTL